MLLASDIRALSTEGRVERATRRLRYRFKAAEVAALASTYRDAAVIDGPSATCGAVLEALDGAWLAHIGAHGTFRGDNPMFSALQLTDGPLTVFDIERLRRPPYRLVLSACESGVGAPTGDDELRMHLHEDDVVGVVAWTHAWRRSLVKTTTPPAPAAQAPLRLSAIAATSRPSPQGASTSASGAHTSVPVPGHPQSRPVR